MIIPVRCYTCGKVVGNKWETFNYLKSQNLSNDEIFNKLNLQRYCCRRMLLTHVEIIDKIIKY